MELHRQVHGLVEHAVDAVADAEGLFVGLEMDVARPFLMASMKMLLTRVMIGASSVDRPVSVHVESSSSLLDDRDLGVVGQFDVLGALLGPEGVETP